jgi:DNA-directed RNA polymerase subunit RPC12/RpoP
MSYFLHNECGSQVRVDISGHVKVLLSYGIGKTVLRAGSGDLYGPNETTFNTKFFCIKCDKHVGLDDVSSRCMYCGNIFPLENLYKPSQSGGIYCTDHARVFKEDGETLKKLSTLASRFSMKAL